MNKKGFRNRNARRKRKAANYILVYCEGEKTEPNYFKAFNNDISNEEIIVEAHGDGRNTTSLVKWAITECKKEERNKEILEKWVVFDQDSFKKDNFDNAINKARSHGFKVAWSNECFELWYILHFEYLNSALNRDQYSIKLTKLLDKEYEKNDEKMYSIIKDKQRTAISNAKKLITIHRSVTPNKCKPCTTVHWLVESLNRFTE